jgi:lipid-binding SYLF domain-containing protein
MKKTVLFLLTLALCVTTRAANFSRADYVTRLDTCEAILQGFFANPAQAIPADVLRRAKGIVIVNQLQFGFVIGVKDGWGVAMVKKPDGRWSVPIFINAGEMSLGLQAGGKSIETVMVLMDDAATRMLFKSRINFGVDAKAVAGPRAAETERSTALRNAQVLVYTSVKGLYAGATVKTGSISPNLAATRTFYSTDHGIPEILYSNWVNPQPECHPLMNYLQRLSP